MSGNPLSGIEQLLRSLIADRLKVKADAVPLDASIMEELGLESIEVMQFLLEIEERYPDFRFSDPNVSELQTLRDLANHLEMLTRGMFPREA
jgi:acyl carrier protein